MCSFRGRFSASLNLRRDYNVPVDELADIFINETPLIDVRAPVEFAQGAFPNAVNLPILDDEQRRLIGICYKEQGQQAAIALGNQLVAGDLRHQRTLAWQQFIQAHPDALLYCFRGGLRSQTATDWLTAAGTDIQRIEGGYKKLRQYLRSQLENLPDFLVIGGKTGTGKTEFLRRFDEVIDLEGLANHRGSAFGGFLSPQPAQIDFENLIAIELLKKKAARRIMIEDEGRLIGRIHVPPSIQQAMKQAPLLLIEESLAQRTEHIYQEYIVRQWQAFEAYYGEQAHDHFSNYLLGAIDAIRKRLGNVAHRDLRHLMLDALSRDAMRSGQFEGHRAWITCLLNDYYDPMYNYQLSKKQTRVHFSGTADEVEQWYLTNKERLA